MGSKATKTRLKEETPSMLFSKLIYLLEADAGADDTYVKYSFSKLL